MKESKSIRDPFLELPDTIQSLELYSMWAVKEVKRLENKKEKLLKMIEETKNRIENKKGKT